MNLPTASGRLLQGIFKFLVVLAGVAAWWGIYKAFNNFNAAPGRAIHWTRPVDVTPWVIQPWTSLFYLAAGLAFPLAPLVVFRTWRGIGRTALCYGLLSAITFAVYAVFPLSIRRPEFDSPGAGAALMRAIVSVDNEANCLPSFHASFAVLGALLLLPAVPSIWGRVLLWLGAIAVCITTVTTGQHYYADAPAGAAAAFLAYGLARWIWPGGFSAQSAPPLAARPIRGRRG